eukprot:scaffold3058_cov232-Pinguiococcus_pyrenoidosus.AAC.8
MHQELHRSELLGLVLRPRILPFCRAFRLLRRLCRAEGPGAGVKLEQEGVHVRGRSLSRGLFQLGDRFLDGRLELRAVLALLLLLLGFLRAAILAEPLQLGLGLAVHLQRLGRAARIDGLALQGRLLEQLPAVEVGGAQMDPLRHRREEDQADHHDPPI